MRPLAVERLPEYTEESSAVSSWSTIRVKHNAYSVPSRLIGERVAVRVYESRLEVYYGGEQQLAVERLRGEGKHRINYRHVIWSLVRSPEPSPATATARSCSRRWSSAGPTTRSDAAAGRAGRPTSSTCGSCTWPRATMESEVEAALELLLRAGSCRRRRRGSRRVVAPRSREVPGRSGRSEVDLASYDALLAAREEVADDAPANAAREPGRAAAGAEAARLRRARTTRWREQAEKEGWSFERVPRTTSPSWSSPSDGSGASSGYAQAVGAARGQDAGDARARQAAGEGPPPAAHALRGRLRRAGGERAGLRPAGSRQDAPAVRHRPRARPARLPRAVRADLPARPAAAGGQARPDPRGGAAAARPLRRRASSTTSATSSRTARRWRCSSPSSPSATSAAA